jgi:ribosomal protein S18 acetylase RimI-like enzyme
LVTVTSVHDRGELEALLRRDTALHAYELGDLDDLLWPYTTWYRHGDAVALLYHGARPPILVALDHRTPPTALSELLDGVRPLLPRRFYAHLSPGVDVVLTTSFVAEPRGPHLKMALTDRDRLRQVPPAGDPLGPDDLPDLVALYEAAYPANSFDERMLETGQYMGIRRDGGLVAVAGVHVWSPAYRVSALGNVATHPSARGHGLATAAVAALCGRLLETVDHVALNVKADNIAAIGVYRRLGFTPVAEYSEFIFEAR